MDKKTNVILMQKEVGKIPNKYKLTIEWLSSLRGEKITEKDFIERFPFTVEAIGQESAIEAIKLLNDFVFEKEYGCIEEAIKLEERFQANCNKSKVDIFLKMKYLV